MSELWASEVAAKSVTIALESRDGGECLDCTAEVACRESLTNGIDSLQHGACSAKAR